MNKKVKVILYIILIILCFTVMMVLGYIDDKVPMTKETKCFDKFNHEIKDQICYSKETEIYGLYMLLLFPITYLACVIAWNWDDAFGRVSEQ